MATLSNVNFSLVIENNPYATEAAKNATYYYNTQGDATAEYFLTANIGTVTASNGFANVNLTANLDSLGPSESKAFSIKIRKNSHTGPVIATSNTINIIGEDILYTQATGGNTVVSSGYKIHEFRSSANLIVTSVAAPVNNQVDYVVVAGGGGGGEELGGGGGAGGMLTGTSSSSILTQAGNLLVIVGAGGNGTNIGATSGYPPATLGTRGGNSQLGSFITVGGGVGRTYEERTPTPANLVSGGSGGGQGGGGASNPPAGTIGTGISGQGNPGTVSPPIGAEGGAGGGAGDTGTNAIPSANGKRGGNGLPVTWVTPFIGTSGPTPGRWFAGGGGGGHYNPNTPFANGGFGGGGPGKAQFNFDELNGTAFTGGGGGGGPSSTPPTRGGGTGGSGAVAIRYPFKSTTVNYIVNSTVTRISNSSSMTYAIVTTGLTANARLYYTLTGNVTSADIDTPLSGSFIVSNNRANVQIVSNASAVTNRVFALQMRRLSTNGRILATGNTILIAPSSYIEATGGTVITENGFRTHVFTGSGNLTISGLGISSSLSNLEYLVVAGGGSGGGYAGVSSYYSGGGGAGGLLQGNISANIGNYTIVVGAGGIVNAPTGVGGIGGNSIIALGASNILVAIGGGGGGAGVGNFGGSGGGNDGYTPGPPYGQGINGQGNPGGAVSFYIGGGGGGAGQPGQNTPTNTRTGSDGRNGGNGISVSWVTPAYGTPGPAPGRWFAGGGAGNGTQSGSSPGVGGVGGGGGRTPAVNGYFPNPFGAGQVNTGGGGLGNGENNTAPASLGYSGGSGVVIVRYPYIP